MPQRLVQPTSCPCGVSAPWVRRMFGSGTARATSVIAYHWWSQMQSGCRFICAARYTMPLSHYSTGPRPVPGAGAGGGTGNLAGPREALPTSAVVRLGSFGCVRAPTTSALRLAGPIDRTNGAPGASSEAWPGCTVGVQRLHAPGTVAPASKDTSQSTRPFSSRRKCPSRTAGPYRYRPKNEPVPYCLHLLRVVCALTSSLLSPLCHIIIRLTPGPSSGRLTFCPTCGRM